MDNKYSGQTPKTFKEKWDNYWYHYKFRTIVGIALGVMAIFLIKDIFFKPKYDITITYLVKGYIDLGDYASKDEGDYVELENMLMEYIDDYNGDGKKNIDIRLVELPAVEHVENLQLYNAMSAKFMSEFAIGNMALYIMPPELVESMDMTDKFLNLSEKYPDNSRMEGLGMYIGDALEDAGIKVNEGEGYIFLRDGNASGEKQYEADVKFFESIMNALGERAE